MFGYKSYKDRINDERKRTEYLNYATEKNIADIAYIAMMSDVELEDETEGEYDAQQEV